MTVRFAPSPTGTLHIGNLRTAWISYQIAQQIAQPWIVRIEDIDTPRVVPGAEKEQLAHMAELGLIPTRVIRQSESRARHWKFFLRALSTKKIYPCTCSRKEVLQNLASAPHGPEAIYDGHCRDKNPQNLSPETLIAWRFRADDPSGTQDFVISRTLGEVDAQNPDIMSSYTPAYHWACALDDWCEAHSWIVRAWDLESAWRPQRAIHRWARELEGSVRELPAVYHTALVVRGNGQRLEKRTQGIRLPELKASGIGVPAILAAFQRSWQPPQSFHPIQDVLGEGPKSLDMDALLKAP